MNREDYISVIKDKEQELATLREQMIMEHSKLQIGDKFRVMIKDEYELTKLSEIIYVMSYANVPDVNSNEFTYYGVVDYDTSSCISFGEGFTHMHREDKVVPLNTIK
jgi:hypothetical protein